MDRVIKNHKRKRRLFVMLFVSFLVISGLLSYALIITHKLNSIKVDTEKLQFSTVRKGVLEEFVPTDATIDTSKSFPVCVKEKGTIIKFLVSHGQYVQKGDPIAIFKIEKHQAGMYFDRNINNEIYNSLQERLAKMSQKMEVLQLQHSDINKKFRSIQKDYKYSLSLKSKGEITAEKFQKISAHFKKTKKKYSISKKKFFNDSILMDETTENLKVIIENYIQDEKIIVLSAKEIKIVAPHSGYINLNQNYQGVLLSEGHCFARIWDGHTPRFMVRIDKSHNKKVDVGQNARIYYEDTFLISTIDSIIQSPEGNILLFAPAESVLDKIPLQNKYKAQIIISSTDGATIIDMGSSVNETGGRWVYVLNANGTRAKKRKTEPGKSNIRFLQITSGLELGETVIISTYSHFKDKETLILK